MRIRVAVAAVDFRKGIDGLAALCRQAFQADPWSGTVFVFRNRRATALRLFLYDGQGFWLCHKRLSKGRLVWWPEGAEPLHPLEARQLQVLVWNGDPSRIPSAPLWRRLVPAG